MAASLAAPVDNAQIIGRDVQLLSSYDYIVVGGGTSGLVVADRLTENKKSQLPSITQFFERPPPHTNWTIETVLVIEAGNL